MSQGATATVPCGFSRQELNELHKDNFGKPLWSTYFFTNTPGTKKHPPRHDLDDNVPRCLKCGHTDDEHGSSSTVPARFVCRAVIPNCKRASGIRSLIFSAAQAHLARFHNSNDPQDSIVYAGDDLHVCVVFGAEGSPGGFLNAVTSLGKHPACIQGIQCDISADNTSSPGRYVKDTDSPCNSLECLRGLAESSISVVLRNSDLFKYQMLENPVQPFLPECAHIVPDKKRFRDGDPTDNYLALYRCPMHQLFDGIGTVERIPQVKLLPGVVGTRDEAILRTPVQVVVQCKSREIYTYLGPYMQVGAVHDDAAMTITCTVHVQNPEAFCLNLRTRAKTTESLWEQDNEGSGQSDCAVSEPESV